MEVFIPEPGLSCSFQMIRSFNEEAGLLDKPHNPYLEAAFQIEEALEGFTLDGILEHIDIVGNKVSWSPKTVARHILLPVATEEIDFLAAVDKSLDSIVFAVGSLLKLGLNEEDIETSLRIVMEANLAKLENVQLDDAGKLMKGESFVGPEERLGAYFKEKGIME